MHRCKGLVRARGAGRTIVVLALLFAAAMPAGAENWTRFRGPNGQGISAAKTIPAKWSPQEYNWKIELPGGGHSSPVVWDDKVFVTCADEKARQGILLCVRAADGQELWRKECGLDKVPMNGLNNYASATPALDDERIYLFWPGVDQTLLMALTHDGREVWTAKLPGNRTQHGMGSSPIIVGESVIVTREQDQKSGGDIPSVWLAVDRKTGQVQWRYEHPESASASYSTPCVYRDRQGREQVVFTSNSRGLAALNPLTGKLLWQTPAALPARVVSSPFLAGDLVIGTCGEGGRGIRLSAIRPPEDVSSEAKEVYGLQSAVVPYVPTCVVHDGYFFGFHDGGLVSCFRIDTGEVLWSQKPAGRYFGSPVYVDGKLYCITVDGDVVVLRAGPKYELLGVNPLGEKSHATPAVANGRMFLRTFSHLISVGGRTD
ncbi:MAG: PQQ-binding-like beta-propeller repeat protein [Phycisphaerae bacterium]|nr:PQQ-binding-like beta-propeller repeat protein [Phycisphaerae bacterium]